MLEARPPEPDRQFNSATPNFVMVVLGTTIHEFV